MIIKEDTVILLHFGRWYTSSKEEGFFISDKSSDDFASEQITSISTANPEIFSRKYVFW